MKSIAVFSVAGAVLLTGFAHAAAIRPVSSNHFITIDGKEVSLEPPNDSAEIEARGHHHGHHLTKAQIMFINNLPVINNGTVVERAESPAPSNQFITIDGKEVSLQPPNKRAEALASSNEYITIDGKEVSLEPPTKSAEFPISDNKFITIGGKEMSLEPPATDTSDLASSDASSQVLEKRCLPLCAPVFPVLALLGLLDKKKLHKLGPVREYTIDAKGRLCIESHRPAVGTCFAQRYKGYHHYCPDAARRWASAPVNATGPVQVMTGEMHNGVFTTSPAKPGISGSFKKGSYKDVGTCFAQRYKGYHHYCPDAARRWASAPVNATGPVQVMTGEMHNGVFTTSPAKPGISGSFKKGSYKDGVPGHPIDPATAPQSGFISGARIPGKPGFVSEIGGNGFTFDNDGNPTWSDTEKPVASKPVNGTSSRNETVTVGDQEVHFQNGAATWAATGKPFDGSAMQGGIIKVGGRVVSLDDLMSASFAKDDLPKSDSGKIDPSLKDATAVLPIGDEISKSAKGGTMKLNGLPSAETLSGLDSNNVGAVDNGSELPKADGKTHRKLIPRRAAGSAQES